MSENHTMNLFVHISLHRMCSHYLPKLVQAINLLSKGDIWNIEIEGYNSIGGIVLHICEHVKRNTNRYLESSITYSNGIEEYFPNQDLSSDELIRMIENTFSEWKEALISYRDSTNLDMFDLYHLVEHTGYHLGQIVDRSKRALKSRFNFCQNGLNEKNLKSIIEDELTNP